MTRNVRRVNNINNAMNNQNISEIKNNNIMEEKEKKEEKALPLVHESCNYSNFSFAVAVSGLLAFAGILVYALMI